MLYGSVLCRFVAPSRVSEFFRVSTLTVRRWDTGRPAATTVYDKFQLIKNYHQVTDEVRGREWRRADEEEKDLVRGQRYTLFRNEENLTGQQDQTRQRLLDENERLTTAAS